MTAVRTFSALVILVGGIGGGGMAPLCVGCGPRPIRRAADEPNCRCRRAAPTCCSKEHSPAGEPTRPCGNCLHLPPSENRTPPPPAGEPDLSCKPAGVLANLVSPKPLDAAWGNLLRATACRPPPDQISVRTTVLLI